MSVFSTKTEAESLLLNGLDIKSSGMTTTQVQAVSSILGVETGKVVRTYRDYILSASDWTQVADAPVDTAAWATYRQALRDIPAQSGFPDNITWPQEPTT